MNEEHQIIEKLSHMEERQDQHIKNTEKILERHEVILFGKDGGNGLVTTVSKLKSRWSIVIWAIGIFATGAVSLIITLI